MTEETETIAQVELTEVEKREVYCAGLEELAYYLRTNPEAVLPTRTDFVDYVYGKTAFRQAVKVLGTCEKEYTDYRVTVFKNFGPIKYGVYSNRDYICTKTVVGKRIVPAVAFQYYPEIPEHEEDVVEWNCGSILADESAVAEATDNDWPA